MRVARRVALLTVPFLVIIALWQLSAMLLGLPEAIYPRPMGVLTSLGDIARKGILQDYTLISLGRWTIAVGAGLLLTVPVALLFALSATLRRACLPTVNFFHAIAELAWLPILVIWFGFGELPVILTLMYVVFFPVLYNTMVGIETVPPTTIASVQTLGASRLQLVRHVLVPGALPYIVSGIRVGGSFAFRALVAAEVIAAASGLGFMIFQARSTQQLDRSVAGMVVIGIIWVIVDWAYLRPLEAATVERWGTLRSADR
jgi:NitT/TauT family transport system permease protein/taurine transport system permease protein